MAGRVAVTTLDMSPGTTILFQLAVFSFHGYQLADNIGHQSTYGNADHNQLLRIWLARTGWEPGNSAAALGVVLTLEG
jgi:hypothetical protein